MAGAREAIRIATAANDPQAIAAAHVALEQARGESELASGLENVLLSQISGVSGGDFGAGSFLDDPTVIRSLAQLATSSRPVGERELGPMMSNEELVNRIESGSWGSSPRMAVSTDPSLPDASRYTAPIGVISQLRRKLTLLDLIPTSTMEGLAFSYAKESGSFTTAAETAERAVKPQGDDPLVAGEVRAKTIAHWNKVARQQLADTPALAVTLQSRLLYGVLRRLEDEIVAGSGTAENLLGIVNTTGIASVPYAAGTPLADLALTGQTDVLLSDAQPNAVVLHPSDWASMLTAKASGSGEYLSDSGPFGMNPDLLWGLAVIASKVMPVGQALIGDFTQGCTLYVREAPNVRISDSDQDDFIRNVCTVLAEGRFGLAIWRPACFAVVHLA